MKCILFLALVAVCSAQLPTPCQSPQQWQGRRSMVDRSKQYAENAKVYYDETNRRVRILDEVEQGREREFYDTLSIHTGEVTGTEYRVNMRTKQCNVTQFLRPFRQFGVPREAKFVFEVELGAAQIDGEHLTAVVYEGNSTIDNVRYLTWVTFPDCVPIQDNYYNSVTGYIESHYYDIHLGITSPEMFIPPSECIKDFNRA